MTCTANNMCAVMTHQAVDHFISDLSTALWFALKTIATQSTAAVGVCTVRASQVKSQTLKIPKHAIHAADLTKVAHNAPCRPLQQTAALIVQQCRIRYPSTSSQLKSHL